MQIFKYLAVTRSSRVMAGCCGDAGHSSSSGNSSDPDKDLSSPPSLATLAQELGFKLSPLTLPKDWILYC